jgi:hypothetical protein
MHKTRDIWKSYVRRLSDGLGFFHGFTVLLDLAAGLRHEAVGLDDSRAVALDWEAVGDDLRTAMNVHEKNAA